MEVLGDHAVENERISMQHCDDHEGCMRDIRTALYGNGTPGTGISFKVTEMLNSVDLVGKRLTEHRRDIQDLKDAILGTMDKKGIKTIVMEHEDYIKPQRDSWNGLINWIYKGMMVAGMIVLIWTISMGHKITF